MKNMIAFFFTILITTIHVNAHPSWGIVVDKQKNIYFTDIMHNGRGSVWKLHNDGKLELLLQDFHAHNVNLDAQGNLVTAHGEMDEHFIVSITKEGLIDTLFQTNDYTNFNGGNCFYTPKGEIIFQAENYFWRLKENGDKEKISAHVFEWNQTIFADSKGNYYGPDIGDGKGHLVKIDSAGNATIIAEYLITKFEDRPYDKHNDILMGISEGCEGNIYVAELAGQRIIKILENGEIETFYQSEGNWKPSGLDFFAGDAYILEFEDHHGLHGPQIIKINEAGEKEILFNYDNYYETSEEKAIPTKNDGHSNLWLYLLITGSLTLIIFWIYSKKQRTS